MIHPIRIQLLACCLAAHGIAQQVEAPRPPSVGRQEKITEYVPAKDARTEPPAGRQDQQERPARTPAQKAAGAAGMRSLEHMFDDPDFVLFDQPQNDGVWWAMGSNFKASFDGAGWSFIPRPLAGAPDLAPIRFRLASASIGADPIAIPDAAPVRSGNTITCAHGTVRELIDVRGRGVEQSFTFESLPQRGELVLQIDATTGLAGHQQDQGIEFSDQWDRVSYSQAVAVDAAGQRVAAVTTLQNGRITIRVPAAFIASAMLPLVVDPWIAQIMVTSDTHDLADPDVAWDDYVAGGQWAVVYARYFGGSDWDCFVQRLDETLHLVGTPLSIDFTSDAWQRPRIANCFFPEQAFLIVAQVRSGTAPFKVSGRIMYFNVVVNPPTYSTRAQFVIAADTVDNFHPDVGGDPTFTNANGRATFFTVVWERAYSATDHDILARQVDSQGVLQGSTPIYVQLDTHNQSWPSISKGAGRDEATLAPQRFAIVYQQTFSATDEDIYGALLTWDGQIVTVNGSNTFVVDFSGLNDTFPQVSSPTEGTISQRLLLAVYERTNSNGGDIIATCFDHLGTIVARGNINQLENDATRLPWPQRRPSVDSDGRRFEVGYHEAASFSTDLDTRVSLVGVGAGGMIVEEAGVPLGFTGNPEFNMQIASEYSGTGYAFGDAIVCATNDRDNSNGLFAIDTQTYGGVPAPAFSSRSLGCGTVGLLATGTNLLGGRVVYTVNSGANLGGLILGFQANLPVGPCPGCTIGVDGSAMIVSTFTWNVPRDPSWIGLRIAAQAFMFAPVGPCLSQIHLSNTIDFTVY